jgi:fucose permease
MRSAPRALTVVIAFVAFVSLGLPDGVLGVAWPSMRRTFDLPVSHLGAILFGVMAGYLASSFASGAIVERHGVGPLLAWSNALVALSCLGYALAPVWPLMLVAALIGGLGAGAIDAGINAHAAERFSPRLVSWLHASWSAGASLGPLIMTAVLTAGLAWQRGYVVVASLLAAMAITFFVTTEQWGRPAPSVAGEPARPSTFGATLARPAVWAHMAIFFLYTGLEGSAGQWAYTLLTEARGVPPRTAGPWVAGYWGSIAVGRVVCGVAAERFAPETLVRASVFSALLATVIVWSDAGSIATLLGLGLLGFALAPVFPMLIASTPARLGAEQAAHAIGFQVSAACLGAAAMPALAGLIARQAGVASIPAVLLANAVALVVILEAAGRRGSDRAALPRPSGT